MAVTQHWISTNSSYERLVAKKPLSEGRSFNKPLLYNHGEDDVFPNFVLSNCSRSEVPVGVRAERLELPEAQGR
jgi:hypothetical protein